MKKNLLTLATLFLLFASSCKRNDDEVVLPDNGNLVEKQHPAPVPQGSPYTASVIDQSINTIMESKKDFHWEWVDLKTLWSAVVNSDHTVAVGYKLKNSGSIDHTIDKINLKEKSWKAVHDALIELVVAEINKHTTQPVTAKEIIVEDDAIMPIITFKITDVMPSPDCSISKM